MKPQKLATNSQELDLLWFLVPLGLALATLAAMVVLTLWPNLPSEPRTDTVASEALSITPGVSLETAVPSASSVFTDRSYEAVRHVEAF